MLVALSIGLFWVAKPTPFAFWIGLPLIIVGEVVRVWASGYLTKLSGLVTAGPFALCRNPLYIGSFLICLGYLIMCHRLDAFIIGLFLFWVLHGAAIVYEEKLLLKTYGQDFEDYRRAVPRFIPRFRPRKGKGSFSFAQVLVNAEHRGAIATMILTTAFGFLAYDLFSAIQR
ncbi:MAG: isoprenylcysteine carboxylmethyltransferase family protein [Armatimonadetes bacterium]|nr:isoprenylcysteine carboxylmethyltransferase family protein [Armatimonadota bacterium]